MRVNRLFRYAPALPPAALPAATAAVAAPPAAAPLATPLLAAALLATLLSAVPLAAQAPARPTIDSLALRAHTYFLADDLLEGRGTGRRGADVAAAYIAAAAAQLGLRPAAGGSFFQPVPLIEAEVDTAATRLTLEIDDQAGPRRVSFTSPATFIPNVGTARTLVSFAGEVAWVGRAADVLSQAARLPPLTGRVALMDGVFGADAAAADSLRARGATGVIHLLGDPELYGLYARSRGGSRMYLDDPAVASSFVPDIPAVIAHPSLTRALLAGTVNGDEDLAHPFAMPGRRVNVTVATRARPVPARNVAALLPGRDPARRAEVVVYSAHYDHLGISTPDETGDSIYNGFSDNAAGSAMLLAIAGALAAQPPERPALFLWFTGEERGLLGSDWFVAHPVLPLADIVGVINLDAGAPPAPSVTWRVAGGDRSTLGALATDVARRAGWDATVSSASPNTDYFPFLRVGVPAVFLVPGPGAYQGLTGAESQALRARWDRYHQAGDHWHADFPFAGLVRYADFALRLGLALDTATRPRLLF